MENIIKFDQVKHFTAPPPPKLPKRQTAGPTHPVMEGSGVKNFGGFKNRDSCCAQNGKNFPDCSLA
jgi:hypothetical protein